MDKTKLKQILDAMLDKGYVNWLEAELNYRQLTRKVMITTGPSKDIMAMQEASRKEKELFAERCGMLRDLIKEFTDGKLVLP